MKPWPRCEWRWRLIAEPAPEDYHHAVTGIAFQRAVVLRHANDFANGCMVVVQQGHHVFGVCIFSENLRLNMRRSQKSAGHHLSN